MTPEEIKTELRELSAKIHKAASNPLKNYGSIALASSELKSLVREIEKLKWNQ